MIHVVSISDLKIADKKEDVLITYSLGSCIGVTLYDKASGIGGMLHALLPQSKMNPQRAEQNPFMFVDSGFSRMLDEFKRRGANPQKLICKVAGGGKFLDPNDVFKTGERNYTILRKMLWKNRILIAGEDVGGTIPRTMVLYMASGKTAIRSGGKEKLL
ncbi:MAG: chemotaxis protein CheD [Candidatus Omnitrophica bacterium]|nr:chemotaxis protein CheD [Candidatus Omnitrophota bacterium]